MCIKDSINKTCWINSKDPSNGFLKLNFETIQKNIFRFLPKFSEAMDEVENFFCQFPNPWPLRVSGMGCYASKCNLKTKQNHCTLLYSTSKFNECCNDSDDVEMLYSY
jgi:hypothetical protein